MPCNSSSEPKFTVSSTGALGSETCELRDSEQICGTLSSHGSSVTRGGNIQVQQARVLKTLGFELQILDMQSCGSTPQLRGTRDPGQSARSQAAQLPVQMMGC